MNSDPIPPDDFLHIADTKIVQLFLGLGGGETEKQANNKSRDHQKQCDCDVDHLCLPILDLWEVIERIWRQKRGDVPAFA